MASAYLKTMQYCAFCRHWDDPTRSCIRPVDVRIDRWEFDQNEVRKCMLHNRPMRACNRCYDYDRKV